jgi:16S rRNA (cytosine967-C5)-methyltransferase
LTAVDNDIARVARITQNFTRLDLKASHIIHGNASQPAEWWNGKLFDRILADVPCSASGVTRRHPDIKWLRRESDLFQFVAKQKEILDALWQILARGGKLLYATCSVFSEENELQVKNFLHYHADACVVPISGIEAIDGQLLPNSHHDGFFYALLHKA